MPGRGQLQLSLQHAGIDLESDEQKARVLKVAAAVHDRATNKSLLPNSFRHRVSSRRNFERELVLQEKRNDKFKLHTNPPVGNGFNEEKHTGTRFWLARLEVVGD